MALGNSSSEFKYLDVIGMAFVAVLLVSNIAAQKLFACGPFTFTTGIIIFPVAYIFGDILTEVYGYARSRRVIWVGFVANLFMVVILAVAVWLPPADGWPFQDQFATTLGMVPRVVVASMVGYWAGEFSNSYVLARMKLWTEGRHLWMRTISSTVVGEGVDTFLFVVVAFAGVLPAGVLVSAGLAGYIFKVLYEIAITPVTYVVVGALKRLEGVDVFDRETNFNPFRLSGD